MQPSIRKMLLSVPESSNDQTENVFFQMQASKRVLTFAKTAVASLDIGCCWRALDS